MRDIPPEYFKGGQEQRNAMKEEHEEQVPPSGFVPVVVHWRSVSNPKHYGYSTTAPL